ncbi:MAG: GIY-YIG nuclease family protein [Bacteriovoracaceae bacterium]
MTICQTCSYPIRHSLENNYYNKNHSRDELYEYEISELLACLINALFKYILNIYKLLFVSFFTFINTYLAQSLTKIHTFSNSILSKLTPNKYFITLLNRTQFFEVFNKDLSFSGIYYIVNLNNKFQPVFYVGESSNIGERIKAHFESLRKGNHHSVYNNDQSINLQRDFIKYGEDAFYFGILEKMHYSRRYSREEIEASFIKKLNSFSNGYNAVSHQKIARRKHGYSRTNRRY